MGKTSNDIALAMPLGRLKNDLGISAWQQYVSAVVA